MTKVLVLGGVSFNTMIYLERLPPPEPGTVFSQGFHETVGSTGAGKALNLRPLGLDVLLFDLIGADAYGRRLQAHFAEKQIPFIHQIDPEGTKRHVNLMTPDGRRLSIFLTNGAFNPDVDWTAVLPHIAQADYVALNILNYCRDAIPLIKQADKPIWCDIHDYDGRNPYHQEFIAAADVLFMSSEQMPDYRPFMSQLVEQGKEWVVCTHGRDGATAVTAAGDWLEIPIIPDYELQDSNGAGDAFFAGCLWAHSRGLPPKTCLQMAAVVAGLCITSSELAAPELNPARAAADFTRYWGEEFA